MSKLHSGSMVISSSIISKMTTALMTFVVSTIVVAGLAVTGAPDMILPWIVSAISVLLVIGRARRIGSQVRPAGVVQLPDEKIHLQVVAAALANASDRNAQEALASRLASIVNMHAGLAVGSALLPIPGVDVAAAAANVWTMFARINKEVGLPFSENAVKSLAAGIVANFASTATSLLVFGSVLKFVPGLGSLGGAAVMAATSAAVTKASGVVYMKAATEALNKKTARVAKDEDLSAAADEILKNVQMITAILKAAKNS
jgi:uncharacterized protein (DUF697 family)